MWYQFTNFTFKIDGFTPVPLKEFNIFKNTYCSTSDICNINIDIIDEFPKIHAKIVYYDQTGVTVLTNNTTEYRVFSSLLTGECFAILEDTPAIKMQKKLFLSKKYIQHYNMTDRSCINCLAFEKTLNENNRLILHASFIKTQCGAILFVAPSGTGKSTQASLWKRYKGTEIINGDRAAVWKTDNVWYAGGVPWCGTSNIMKNDIVPLVAIILLEQGESNTIVIPSLIIKIKKLIEQTTINPWNMNMQIHSQNLLMELCMDVPIYHFSCKPNKEAVDKLACVLGV